MELKDKKKGSWINLTLAFTIGFCRFFFSIILEVMSLLYLTSLGSFVFILVCYGTIGTVASFEKIYASSLIDHPIKECIGKKLQVMYKRRMHKRTDDFFSKTPDIYDNNERYIKCKTPGCTYAIEKIEIKEGEE